MFPIGNVVFTVAILYPRRDSKRNLYLLRVVAWKGLLGPVTGMKSKMCFSRMGQRPTICIHRTKADAPLITRPLASSCSTWNTFQFSLIHLVVTCIDLQYLPMEVQSHLYLLMLLPVVRFSYCLCSLRTQDIPVYPQLHWSWVECKWQRPEENRPQQHSSKPSISRTNHRNSRCLQKPKKAQWEWDEQDHAMVTAQFFCQLPEPLSRKKQQKLPSMFWGPVASVVSSRAQVRQPLSLVFDVALPKTKPKLMGIETCWHVMACLMCLGMLVYSSRIHTIQSLSLSLSSGNISRGIKACILVWRISEDKWEAVWHLWA